MAGMFGIFRRKKEEDDSIPSMGQAEFADGQQETAHKGKLIVFEGNDGSGKNTQVKMLAERFRTEGRKVEVVDFPDYSSFYGKLIKQYLEGKFGRDVNPYLISLAYANDRLLKKDIIIKWLDEGKIVLCNRYVASNKAHQAVKLKTPEQMQEFVRWVDEMEYNANSLPRPDITIYLYVPADIAFGLIQQRSEKAKSRADIHEMHDYMSKVEQVYLAMSKNRHWIKVDCIHGEEIFTMDEIGEKVYQIARSII